MHTLHTPDRIIESIVLQAIRNPGLLQGDVGPVGELETVGAFVVSGFFGARELAWAWWGFLFALLPSFLWHPFL